MFPRKGNLVCSLLFLTLSFGCLQTGAPKRPYPPFKEKQFGTLRMKAQTVPLHLPEGAFVTVLVTAPLDQRTTRYPHLEDFWLAKSGKGQPYGIEPYLERELVSLLGNIQE